MEKSEKVDAESEKVRKVTRRAHEKSEKIKKNHLKSLWRVWKKSQKLEKSIEDSWSIRGNGHWKITRRVCEKSEKPLT